MDRTYTTAISVIVPVYKAEKSIRRCVDSILAQTHTDWELYLIDDGSPDRSGAICDDYAAKDPRIKTIHKKNGGVSEARNLGIDLSHGEFIAFIDADDWVDADYLELLYQEKDSDLVCGDHMYEPLGHIRKGEKRTYEGRTLAEYVTPKFIFNGYPWGKLFKTSILRKHAIRFKPIKVYEDFIFCLEYASHCKRVSTTGSPSYHYWSPSTKNVEVKFPLTPKEVIWLYREGGRLIEEITKKHNAPSFAITFNLYLHLPLTKLYQRGDDSLLRDTYQTLHPQATDAQYLNDASASPIFILLDRALKFVRNDKSESKRLLDILRKHFGKHIPKVRSAEASTNLHLWLVSRRCYTTLLLMQTVSARTEEAVESVKSALRPIVRTLKIR